jgi:hypothetical protein
MKRPFLPSLQALAACAALASGVAALSLTARQLICSHRSGAAIPHLIREPPQQVARQLAGETNHALEAELKCFACANGTATNESPRV